MSDIVSLGAHRAGQSSEAAEIRPRDLLLRTIKAIDDGAISPSHMIIVSASTDAEKATDFQIDHAGTYDRFGQIGMLTSAAMLIRGV